MQKKMNNKEAGIQREEEVMMYRKEKVYHLLMDYAEKLVLNNRRSKRKKEVKEVKDLIDPAITYD